MSCAVVAVSRRDLGYGLVGATNDNQDELGRCVAYGGGSPPVADSTRPND